MKNSKKIMLILLLSLALTACFNNKDNKETIKETNSETVKETTKETKLETVKETYEESKKESKAETLTEESKNSESETIKVLEEGKQDSKNADVVETIDTKKLQDEKFNNQMTEEMQKALNDFSVTLIAKDGNTVNKFPKDNLQAIASYKDKDSYGWVIRYGVNKIGLGRYFNASTTQVLVLFDSKNIFQQNSDLVKNDTAEEYKDIAEKILKSEIGSDAEIKYAY